MPRALPFFPHRADLSSGATRETPFPQNRQTDSASAIKQKAWQTTYPWVVWWRASRPRTRMSPGAWLLFFPFFAALWRAGPLRIAGAKKRRPNQFGEKEDGDTLLLAASLVWAGLLRPPDARIIFILWYVLWRAWGDDKPLHPGCICPISQIGLSVYFSGVCNMPIVSSLMWEIRFARVDGSGTTWLCTIRPASTPSSSA